MAGDDKQPTTIEMEPDQVPNYKAAAERYEKLQQLALESSNKLTKQRVELEEKREQASAAVSDAGKAVVEADNAVKVHQRHLDSLQRQHEELGKQIDAAQAAGDTAKARQLDEQYGTQQVEIDKAQAQMATYQGELEARKLAVGQKANELVEVDQQITTARGQEGRSDLAMIDFSNAAEAYRNASHYNELAAVATGGDVGETRAAVLAEADRVSERFQKMAADQAETFEKYRQADTAVKALQGERDIARREQAKLQQDVERAQRAGRSDEAASLQKELDWRTQRVETLDGRIATETANATQLKDQSDFQHNAAQQLRKDAEDLRKLSNESPDTVRDHYLDKTQKAVEQAEKAVPADGPSAEVARQLDPAGEATPAPPPTTDGTGETSIDDEVLGPPDGATDGDGGPSADQPTESDPGAGLDDIEPPVEPGGQPDGAAPAVDGAADETAAPQLLDGIEPSTEPAAAGATTATFSADLPPVEPEGDAGSENADLGTSGAVEEPQVEEPRFEAPPEPETAPEPEPDTSGAEPEFASE